MLSAVTSGVRPGTTWRPQLLDEVVGAQHKHGEPLGRRAMATPSQDRPRRLDHGPQRGVLGGAGRRHGRDERAHLVGATRPWARRSPAGPAGARRGEVVVVPLRCRAR